MACNRFENALLINAGACNPSGIAHSLVAACKECLDEGVSQREDPAVRLIVLQLAFLTDTGRILNSAEYNALVDACKAKTDPRIHEIAGV